MAQFQFRLHPVVRLRLAERDDRRARLAEAYHAERILRDRLEQAVAERNTIRSLVRTASSPGQVNVDALLQTHRYELIVAAQVFAIEQQLVQVAAEVERRQQALVEADRQVRVLEKLRERRLAEFQQLELKREIRQLDEIVQRERGRGMRNEG